MFCRQMKEHHLSTLREHLQTHARPLPLCPIYVVNLSIDKARYTLSVMLGKRHRAYGPLRGPIPPRVSVRQRRMRAGHGKSFSRRAARNPALPYQSLRENPPSPDAA